MRLRVPFSALSLAFGVAGCTAPVGQPLDLAPAPAVTVAALPAPTPEEKQKATEIVSRSHRMLDMDRKRDDRIRRGAHTAAEKGELHQMTVEMRASIPKAAEDAAWANHYVASHKGAVQTMIESAAAHSPLGPDETKKLLEQLKRSGGADAFILKSTAQLRDRAKEIADALEQEEKRIIEGHMPPEDLPLWATCGLYGAAAGAYFAAANAGGVLAAVAAAAKAGCFG